MSTRAEVYKALDGERDYQDERWNENTTTSKGLHGWEDWVIYMEEYLSRMKKALATLPKQESDPIAADNMRKITAMGVAAMEQNGVIYRGEL